MNTLWSKKNIWLVILFTWISLFFVRQTNLASSDLGRHIKNGEIIVNAGEVFHKNLYSYTNTDFPAPNHHWLFGVISYWIYQIAGFNGLTVMGVFLYVAAIFVIFYYAQRRSSFIPAAIATIIALPLLADRSETRPEAFSLLFFSLLFWLCGWIIETKKISHKNYILVGVVALMAAWINIHIFFVLAGTIIGAALLHALINTNKSAAMLTGLLVPAAAAGAVINPLGITLLLYPLHIFSNYGYRVSENQNLWFFLQHFTRPIHWYLLFFMIFVVVVTTYYVRHHFKNSIYHLVIIYFFIFSAFKMIRMENILAISTIPLVSISLHAFWLQKGKIVRDKLQNTSVLMCLSILGFGLGCFALASGLFFPVTAGLGVGLAPGYDQTIAAIKFFSPAIKGPIFNNFDGGSFLIYTLYPHQKVFIDNRAEAYPAEFIQHQYIDAQENQKVWQELDSKYKFGAIIFYRHDATNWGQEFLVTRLQDNHWVPIYVDDYLLLYISDIPEHQELIEQYRLPAEIFSVTEQSL